MTMISLWCGELNYEKLKNFMKKLEECQFFQGFKFHILETMQEAKNGKDVDASTKAEKFR